MRRALANLVAVFASVACTAAHAIEYDRLLADRSRISFAYRQMGVPMEGRFARFDAQISFDPQQPQRGRAVIEIDIASIDTGLAEANDTALGRAWFDAKTHPKARFASTAVRALGGGRYEVTGELTIKGRTRTVTAPFAWRVDGDRAVFTGSLPIRRLQFGIGEGAWSDVSAVADEVEVRFQLTAAAGAAAAVNTKRSPQ